MIEITIAHDPVFNSLSEFAQLLYLKILPHTDDYGRFEGDPITLKARVDPLSGNHISKYIGAMLEISNSHLWLWYITDKNKAVIQYSPESFDRINAFLIKQRKNPEFPEYQDTFTIVEGHMEAYGSIWKHMPSYDIISNKYKVKRNTNQNRKYEFSLETIPKELLMRAGFDEAWEEWVKFRREIKQPLTETAVEKQFSFLLQQPDPVAILGTSIRNGWQGLFPLNNRTAKQEPKAGVLKLVKPE